MALLMLSGVFYGYLNVSGAQLFGFVECFTLTEIIDWKKGDTDDVLGKTTHTSSCMFGISKILK